jgi:methanogenic corrinoid protein MtbC1
MNTQQSGYYSTKELSKLFHVDETTVKRWTNAQKLKCFKTPGGHRKYTSDNVLEFIRTYKYEMDAAPKKVEAPDPLQWVPRPEYSPEMMRELYLNLALKGSVELLTEVLQRSYLSHYPLNDIYENIIGKTASKLLEMQVEKAISKEEMLKAASSIMKSIIQFRLLTPRNLPNGKVAISASLTYGLQDIVLLCSAHILELNGWKVYYLGPNVSVTELMNAARRFSPDALLLPAEYVLADQNGGIDVSFASLATKSASDCMVFDYFNEMKQVSAYVPYQRFSRFDELTEYMIHPTHKPVHATAL